MRDDTEKNEEILRGILAGRPEHDESKRRLKEIQTTIDELLRRQRFKTDEPLRRLEATVERANAEPKRLTIDKRTHRIRFESESETEVTIVIEKREKGGNEVSEDIPDDYIAAAARVVEAARNLDDATRAYKSVQDVVMDAYKRQDDAQKKLQEALENLTQASTGRERKS